MIFFRIPGPDDQNRWNRKNCPKLFHRVIFAFWYSNLNPIYFELQQPFLQIYVNSHIFFESATQIYVNPIFFELIPGPDDQNRRNQKNCPKLFHRVIFAFWIQICNPNLCKSHIFWITANIEKWSFFAWKSVKLEKLPEILS